MFGGVPTGHPGADARAGGETDVYADRARRLGLPFASIVHLGEDGPADAAAIRNGTFAIAADGDHLAYFAPEETALPSVGRWLRKFPEIRHHLRVATPAAIRAALVRSGAAHLADVAVDRLAVRHPQHSAQAVVTSPQAVGGLLLCLLAAAGIYFDTIGTLVAIDLIGGTLFFGVSALRFVAAGFVDRRQPIVAASPVSDRDLPVYTVLLPLYREANLVTDIVASVGALDWPPDRLDVKLLLEADDRATIAAAERAIPGPPFEMVIVPPLGPRTKPKALAFALPLARGEFITVYDAEDRPHPQQLRQAYAAFARSGPDLACLQSALVIDNGDENWLTLLFAIEYAALFDGLLPALAALGMPLPLGGTSNHFRSAVLEKIGGWDPFNVTEDADIGFRLARFGYRSATIDLPTLEDAPVALGPWFRQRSRWFKGWMQTWLVHTRHPQRLVRELGFIGSLGFGLVSTGLIVSSMVYPIYMVALLVTLADPMALWGDGGVLDSMVLGLNLFNLVGGYMAMALLAERALTLRNRRAALRGILLLPAYWLLMSLATYRALIDLAFRPHHWEKTPHRRHVDSGRSNVAPATRMNPVAASRGGSNG